MNRLLSWLLLGASAAVFPIHGSAQYPDKPIKLIVPFAPGTPPDIVGRHTAHKMSEGLGKAFVVENRPGVAGTIGAKGVAKSPGDGYTLLLGTTGSLASAPSLYPNVGYDA